MKLIIVQFIVLSLPAFIYSKCCYDTEILFKIEGDTNLKCSDFGAERHIRTFGLMNLKYPQVGQIQAQFLPHPACKKSVCGDGEKKAGSRFCGKGHCNWAGCDCDGGCIEGDASENFFSKHGAKVSVLDN